MIGDVVGQPGRSALKKLLPLLKKNFAVDFVTVNGENLAGGFGITEKIYLSLMELGIDVFTMGNHWKDKKDIFSLREKYNNIILPQNLCDVSGVENVPVFYVENKKKYVHVFNLMGQFAMKDTYKNPFQFLVNKKENYLDKVNSCSHVLIADIHAEATSEKQAMAWLYNGLFAALIGTHTHTPTFDARLTEQGTAFVSDVGMTGSYDSIIGMNKEHILKKFCLSSQGRVPLEVASEDIWLCAFMVDVSLTTNRTTAFAQIQCRLDSDSCEQNIWNIMSQGYGLS